MTVTTNSNKVQALGNGVTTSFPYSFRIYSATDLVVTRTVIATGVDTNLVLNTDYTVTGAGSYNGGNVVCTFAPADGTRITIRRVIAVTQGTDLRNQGAYFAETHEDVFDRHTMIDQQQQETIDRSLTLAPTSSGVSTALPNASGSKVIGWNEAGTALQNYGPVDNTLLAVQLATAEGVAMVGNATDKRALAASSGAALIGGAAQVVSSIAGLRALLKTSASNKAITTGYYVSGDGGSGTYYYDAADTTTADNGGTVIVATDGGRWKLAPGADVSAKQFGSRFDGATDDTSRFSAAVTVAAATSGTTQGNRVLLPQGAAMIAAQINIPNRVAFCGVNKRGSVLRAAAGHAGPYMLTVINGTSSMFDNALRDVTLDCNDVAGLGGVVSDAWQEGGGMRDVLIQKFKTHGVLLRSGFGGAALAEISQSEIFSAASGALSGIRCDQISAVGAFMLKVRDTTIAGDSVNKLPIGIDMLNDSLHCQNVHFEDCTAGIALSGVGHHVLIGVTGGPGVTNVVEISSNFTGTLRMIGCHRAGATNLIKDNRVGGIGIISSVDTDIWISPKPIIGPGMTNSCGVFDGTTVGTPSASNSFGVSSITRASVGDYTVTETFARGSANAAVTGSCNLAAGSVTVDLVNSSQFRIRTYNASNVLADSNEIKFTCTRVA